MRFHAIHHNDDYTIKTNSQNIVLIDTMELSKDELLSIVDDAVKIERGKYGFQVYYYDDKQLKSLYTRSSYENHINTTTKANQTVREQIAMIYDNTEQMELF